MPLKEIDLKTFDAYKKAIRSDVSRISDSSKTKFWVYKDIELPDAHGKKQKIPAFIALVDDMGIRNSMRGKKLLCTGLCHLEQGKISFEPIKGKVPYLQLKKSVPLFLGKPLHIPSGANEDDEGGETEEDERLDHSTASPGPTASPTPTAPPVSNAQPVPPSTPPPAPQLDPAVTSQWAKLEPQLRSAIASNPARKDVLARAGTAIVEALKAHNSAEAMKRMEAAKALLAPSPQESGSHLNPAHLKEEWGKLVPLIKAANDPALAHAAADAGKQLGELVSHGKLAEAQKLIDQIAARLNRPAAPPPGPPTPAPTGEHSEPPLSSPTPSPTSEGEREDPRKAEYERRWAKLEHQVQQALKDQAGDVGKMRAAVALAGERAEGGDYASALKVLDGLDKLLVDAGAEEEDEDGPPAGLVEYRKTLLRFENARKTVDKQISKLAAAIPPGDDDDDFADALADALSEQLEEIQDLIDEAVAAARDETTPADAALRTKIENGLKQLQSDPLVDEAEKNPYGVAVTIRKTLAAALKDIVDAMPVTV